MESDYSIWKNAACKACAVAVAGVCVAHAVKLPEERPQPIRFYQSHDDPPRQPVPQPQQANSLIAPSSSAVTGHTWPAITGDPAAGNFSFAYINHEGKLTTFSVTRPLES